MGLLRGTAWVEPPGSVHDRVAAQFRTRRPAEPLAVALLTLDTMAGAELSAFRSTDLGFRRTRYTTDEVEVDLQFWPEALPENVRIVGAILPAQGASRRPRVRTASLQVDSWDGGHRVLAIEVDEDNMFAIPRVPRGRCDLRVETDGAGAIVQALHL